MLNCIADNCQYQAKYGKRYTTLKEYCYLHASNMYVDLTLNTCIHVGMFRCENIAKYSVGEGSIAEFCYAHAPYNAVELVSKCLFITCDKTATYGAPDTMVKEYCYVHRDKLHVNLVRRPCAYTDCSKIARYRNTNGKKYCKSHTEHPPKFIKCTKPKCRLTARYGLPNSEPLFCIKHYIVDIHVCVKGNICVDRSCSHLVPVGMNTCDLGHAPVAICKRYKYDDYVQYLV